MNITWTHIFLGAIWYITLALLILALHKGYETKHTNAYCPLKHKTDYYHFDYIPHSNGQWYKQSRTL